MAQYYRRSTPSRYKKNRYKVNKVKLMLIFLISLSVVALTTALASFIFTPKVTLEAIVSEDMNEAAGETEFKISLLWSEFDYEKYEEVDITVGNDVYTIPSDERQIDVVVTGNELKKIKFRAEHTGFGFNLKKQVKFTLPGDNETLNLQESDFELTNKEVVLTQDLMLQNGITSSMVKAMNVELISPINGVIFNEQVRVIDENKEQATTEIRIPLEKLANEFSVKVAMTYERNNTTIRSIVKSDASVDQNEDAIVKATQENGELLLETTTVKTIDYAGHYFYAESLHIKTKELTPPQMYTLVSNGEAEKMTYAPEANGGINLSQLEPGTYYLQLDDQYVVCDELEDSNVWYTVTRDGKATKVTLDKSFGKLVLVVRSISKLPEDVYDIIIDPGHGGLDGGTVGSGTNERDEVLKVATYLAGRLEDHGLKVKLTRTDEFDPVGEGKFDYNNSPYMENGRVEQVYAHQAKYVISNHLNAFDTTIRGYQIYSSVASNDVWPALISNNFLSIGHTARDSEKNENRVSVGSYKQGFDCNSQRVSYGCLAETVDYLYYIRETGGQLSNATTLANLNEEYATIPTYGAETVLVEYAYLDNELDYQEWIKNYEAWGEAVVKATVEYLGISYQTK